jgi:hypothetical protein
VCLLSWSRWARHHDGATRVGLVRTTSVQEWRGSGVAASFIKANIPRGWGWTVTDGESFDAAACINTQLRPDFPDKIHDWPKGGKPADILY